MIVAGFGFRAGATADSLRDAYEQARGALAPDALATAEDKALTPLFAGFSEAVGLPVHGVGVQALQAARTTTQSEASQAARGTGSVAEAAALAAAGPGARLLTARMVSADQRATCALAMGKST
ncbi:cobalamin biosynthesis protein [Pseudoponticoccus marisrubri]|uniref:Precorrin methylase n=1 Tax=Pseudoponticoccus marisrubri TaxID=1685382 RepID=A0A0W7WPB2_9RHOB|nr:cobalamin biosynthesis protein [Pseudoponticoccus marisrubri]KUF12434.1 precorrin methylase [Pseudoponticoccus marisrubri]